MTRIADPALLLALMLLAAIVGGYAGVLVRVPRVVGYLVGGLALHYLLQLLLASGPAPDSYKHSILAAAGQLQGLKTLALGLIMFTMGSVFEVKHIRSVGARILHLSLPELIAVFLLVGLGCTAIGLLTGPGNPRSALTLGMLLGVVGIATAPAATLLVLREYEAKGPNSDAILTLTAINNIVCIVLFHALFFTFAASGLIESSYGTGRWLWQDLLFTSVGSVALGMLLGFAFSVLYAKLTVADFMLIFLGVTLVLGAFRGYLAQSLHLSFNFLLTYLFFGATFANITSDQDAFHKALHTISGPIYALFFALAGFELHLDDLARLGLVGAAYVALRIAGKALGGWFGTRWVHLPGDYRPTIGFGLLCQAGVAIGLADFLYGSWGSRNGADFEPAYGAEAFKTIVLGSVVLFELIGPIALKYIVVRSGEVKAVTLIRRRRTPGKLSGSAVRRSWEALTQALRLGRPRVPPADHPLQVRHIMRSNVKVLNASAPFDEVLRFAEHSRHNHFPVVDDDGRYVGMIHYGDLRELMYAPEYRELITAHDLARQDTPVTTSDLGADELFEVFRATDVGSLAVVEDMEHREVVGIVEQCDLLLVMHANQVANGPPPAPTARP